MVLNRGAPGMVSELLCLNT